MEASITIIPNNLDWFGIGNAYRTESNSFEPMYDSLTINY